MFGGRYFDEFGWDGPAPTEWRRVMLSYPEGRDIRWRMLSDYRLGGVEPKVESAGGMRTLRFEERAIEPLADEPMVNIIAAVLERPVIAKILTHLAGPSQV